MVILGDNPLTVPKEKLKEIKVNQLILSGKPYKKQKQSWVKLIVKGMLSRGKI